MDLATLVAELEPFRTEWARLGANVLCLERVASTQTLARRIVDEMRGEELTPPDSILVALEQTGGRGRQGRAWASPAGDGLYLTLLGPPLPPPDDDETAGALGARSLAELPIRAAVGLADALEALVGVGACRLKWPNDLVTDRGKLAGILIEAVTVGEGRPIALVGVGINCCGDPPLVRASTLERELAAVGRGPSPPLGELASRVVEGLRRAIAHPGGPPLQRYRELSAHRPGDSIRCRVGGEEIRGTFVGFDDRGFLVLEGEQGGTGRQDRRVLAAGEVIE